MITRLARPFLYHNFLILIISSMLLFTASAQSTVPDSLQPWVSWVLKEYPNHSCPAINQADFSNSDNHLCAWPGTLNIDVNEHQATFNQRWHVLAPSWLLLPGNKDNWPIDVYVNKKPIAVVSHGGSPAIRLAKGNFLITGQFQWLKMPDTLKIPPVNGIITLSNAQQKVAYPKRVDNQLWLREQGSVTTAQNSTGLTVMRKISDGQYINLETSIKLNISGEMRQQSLGMALPKGFKLAKISSNIPAYLDASGILHANVKPGQWQIIISAYAPPTLLSWQRPQQIAPWPNDEIWAFSLNEKFRVGKLTGARMIDPTLADLPENWHNLPSYLMTTNDTMTYQISHRGKPDHLADQLQLNRQMWLSFDHQYFSFEDKISGAMTSGWRFDMSEPFLLDGAKDQDGAMLITHSNDTQRGIENRHANVDITVSGNVNNTQKIAVTGWNNDFEQVNLTLNLPPATRLFAVFGADYVSDSWWSNWTIWSCFVVLLSSIFAGRVIGVLTGVVTFVMLVLLFQENEAPVIVLINLLLAVAVWKHQPFKKLELTVKSYLGLSALAALAAGLLFSAIQIRQVIHPQLEKPYHQVSANRDLRHLSQYQDAEVMTSSVSSKRMMLKGSMIKYKKLERYQSDAVLQVGAGRPAWTWQQHYIKWHSPVAHNQNYTLLILNRTANTALKLSAITIMALWFVLMANMLRSSIRCSDIKKVTVPTVNLMAMLILGATLLSPIDVQASEFPNQKLLDQLQQHLLKSPSCQQSCVGLNQVAVDLRDKALILSIEVHSLTDSAIALPQSEFWQPNKIMVNGKRATGIISKNSWLYVAINQGISTIEVSGLVDPVNEFQLKFKQIVNNINVKVDKHWQVQGVNKNTLKANSLGFVVTKQKQQVSNKQQIRYHVSPFVLIKRELHFSEQWHVTTTIERVAPATGSFGVNIALLSGEHLLTSNITVEKGQAKVTFADDQRMITWKSLLNISTDLTLTAAKGDAAEHWQLESSPSWHLSLSGMVEVLESENIQGIYRHSYYPQPGEQLTIKSHRPQAIAGKYFSIDKVNYQLNQGQRSTTINLSFAYRSTRGGEHTIDLPADYQISTIKIDNKVIHLQSQEGAQQQALTLPLVPGSHDVEIVLQAATTPSNWLKAPLVDFNTHISNVVTSVDLTDDRWILSADGPLLGPAVVYWGELIAFFVIALLFGRCSFSPLNTLSWLVLGLGFSLSNWSVLMLVAFWFIAVTASTYRNNSLSRGWYNTSQIGLYLLSIVCLLALISHIPMSLLSSPNMGIVGNSSSGNHLQWFIDHTSGTIPTVEVMNVSRLFYKAGMLLWVIWLCFSLLGWIKWVWTKIGVNGYWQSNTLEHNSD
ncbi:MAG: hypothetical protein HRU24_10150 [Gammaproteobacteria bacterium]|nr:hypothetical protein [Gammaproteobacteria bacterium]